MPDDVPIRGEMIRLGQLLKLTGVAAEGGEAKELIAGGGVTVNGAVESRRGAQLRDGDLVVARGRELRVRAAG